MDLQRDGTSSTRLKKSFQLLRVLRIYFENTNAGAIWATCVIPAKAGIHPLPPWMPASAGMTNQWRNHVVVGGQFHSL
jgi:hypothetical protein